MYWDFEKKVSGHPVFSHEYSAWSAILMRLNVVKFHLFVACFAACNITTLPSLIVGGCNYWGGGLGKIFRNF